MPPGQVLDLGCGLGSELAFLARKRFTTIGVDVSAIAVQRASARYPGVRFVQADVLALPFKAGVFDVLLDRGCFHYMPPERRAQYEQEARRVLRPGGRLLLRACLQAAGVRNDIDESTDIEKADEVQPLMNHSTSSANRSVFDFLLASHKTECLSSKGG